jgi:hypothetical protein
MDYYNKYTKYRTKYLNLKYNNYQYGGVDDDIDKSGIIRYNIFTNVFITKQEKYSISFDPYPAEIIFIFGDTTGNDFFKHFHKYLINADLKNPQDYTESKRLIITSINTSPDILWQIFFKDTKSINDKTKDNIISILNEFINRYCNICFEPSVKSLTEIYIIPDNSIIYDIFTALFSNIKYLPDYLNNIIVEYLFFNLLSHYFLDYQVDFTNYYKDFDKIDLHNIIGIIVYAVSHKLCLFTCNDQLICYNYTHHVGFECDWIKLLADSNELYITPGGELINKQTYNEHMQNTGFNQIAYDRVLYITVLTKWNSTDVQKQTTIREINFNIMDSKFVDRIEYISSIQDKVMQYILAEIYLGRTSADKSSLDMSFLEKNDFILAKHILGKYYLIVSEFEKGYKIFMDNASYKYPLIMDSLCWYYTYTPDKFPSIIISEEVKKWCADKEAYDKLLDKIHVPRTTALTNEEKLAARKAAKEAAAAAALKKAEEEAMWKAASVSVKDDANDGAMEKVETDALATEEADHSKIFICIPNLEGTIENLDLCEALLLENK